MPSSPRCLGRREVESCLAFVPDPGIVRRDVMHPGLGSGRGSDRVVPAPDNSPRHHWIRSSRVHRDAPGHLHARRSSPAVRARLLITRGRQGIDVELLGPDLFQPWWRL